MKTLIMIAMASGILLFAPKEAITQADRYCAKVKDGKVVVMHDGAAITSDVTLKNGVQVKADGSVIDKDGVKRFLREGECVDKEGKTMDPQ